MDEGFTLPWFMDEDLLGVDFIPFSQNSDPFRESFPSILKCVIIASKRSRS